MEMTSAIESANNTNALSVGLLNSHLDNLSVGSPTLSPQVSSKQQENTTSASAGSSPSQKRKTTRVQWACANCRKRKQGCDASRPCRRCVEKGIPCVEVDSKRKRGRAFGKTIKDDSWSPQSLSPKVGSPRISQRLSSSLDLPFDDFQSDSPEEENSSSPHPEEEHHHHHEEGEKCQDHISTPQQKPSRKLPIVKETVSTSSYGLRQLLASNSLQQYQQNNNSVLTHSSSLQATVSNGSNASSPHGNSFYNSGMAQGLSSSPALSASSSNNHLGPTLSQSTGELTIEFGNALTFAETPVPPKPSLASLNLALLCPFLENILEANHNNNNNGVILGDFEPQLLSDFYDQPILTDPLISNDYFDLTFFNEHHVSNPHCSLSYCHKLLISKLNSPPTTTSSQQGSFFQEHSYEKLNKTFPFFSSFQQQQQTDSLKEKYVKVKEVWREIFSSLRSMEWKKVQAFLQDLDSVYSIPSDCVFPYSPAVVLWSPGGRIHHANEAFCQLLGYSLDELRVSAPNLLSPTFMYLNHTHNHTTTSTSSTTSTVVQNNQNTGLGVTHSLLGNANLNSLHFNPTQTMQLFNPSTTPFISQNNNTSLTNNNNIHNNNNLLLLLLFHKITILV